MHLRYTGIGLGAGSVAATAAGSAALPPDRQGLASGVLNTAAQLGTALGLAVLVAAAVAAGVVVSARWRPSHARR